MADEPITPVADPPAPDNNSTIQAMRLKIDEANRLAKEASDRAAAAEAQLKERERAEMAEMERLKAEKAEAEGKVTELEAFRNEHGQFASKLESMYNSQLEAVPEAQRAQVESLSKQGTWADRLEALTAAVQLITPPGVHVPRVQPGHPGPVNDPPVTPPTKTNAEVAKSGGIFGSDLTNVQYRKPMVKDETPTTPPAPVQ